MADDHKVNLEENSKYRVAYDLMMRVAAAEQSAEDAGEPRKYYLNLYHQCYEVVYNNKTFDEVKDVDNPKQPNQNFRGFNLES